VRSTQTPPGNGSPFSSRPRQSRFSRPTAFDRTHSPIERTKQIWRQRCFKDKEINCHPIFPTRANGFGKPDILYKSSAASPFAAELEFAASSAGPDGNVCIGLDATRLALGFRLSPEQILEHNRSQTLNLVSVDVPATNGFVGRVGRYLS
jgi:hypothetical protein